MLARKASKGSIATEDGSFTTRQSPHTSSAALLSSGNGDTDLTLAAAVRLRMEDHSKVRADPAL